MERAEFNQIIKETFDSIEKLNSTKGREYAREEEVFADFTETATAVGITPDQALQTYATKHWRAIQSYAKREQVLSEPIEGRIDDLILYMILYKAMIRARSQQVQNVVGRGTFDPTPTGAIHE